MNNNTDCKHLITTDVTPYHSDVFDHPEYEYECDICYKSVIPFICKKHCSNYKPENSINT